MTESRGFRCADAARDRGDAIAGTAPRGAYWVLIEHRGGWPVNGFEGLDIDWRVRSEVFYAAQALRARILLIRRPGRRVREGPGVWGVMHLAGPDRKRQIWGSWQTDSDLLEIVGALEECGRTEPPAGVPSPRVDEPSLPTCEVLPTSEGICSEVEAAAPVILVCAHGQHDLCCAVRGRPVAAELTEHWPEHVWECTHVGGDRFAANILIVPDGVYYGNLDADTARDVITDHLRDRIRPAHLRGYTDLSPVSQVAVIEALRRNGPAGRFDYSVPDASLHNGTWTVTVRGREPAQKDLMVDVAVARSEATYLTCRGTQKASSSVFDVRQVTPLDAAPADDR